MKKIISLLAVLCLLLSTLPLTVWAKPVEESETPERPVLEGFREPQVLGLENLQKPQVFGLERPETASIDQSQETAALAEDYVSVEEGIAQLREQLMKRNPTIRIKVKSESSDSNEVYTGIFYAALEHTGQPGAGDNLQWQWSSLQVGAGFDCQYRNGYYYYTLPYNMSYYSNADQEAELNAAVDALMEEWAYLEGKSDIEKINVIYNYITANVTYDYYHLETNPDYALMYTAYAALVDGTAVCQGYANLFYRLALELGVDTRIVTGWGWTGSQWGPHAWNLTRIDDLYYYMDVTWDASWSQAGLPYQWYLLGSTNFGLDHLADEQFTDWLDSYSISATDYKDGGSLPDPEIEWPVSGTCGDNLTWTLTQEGVLTISGTGDMWDYPEDFPGWYQYVANTNRCIIEEGVTSIGQYAFYECTHLDEVMLPDSMTRIGYGAFVRCGMLRTVNIGSGITTIDYGAFAYCDQLTDVYYSGSQAQWDQIAIDIADGNNDCLLNANIQFTQGVCGDQLTWRVSNDGVLTISGTGDMWDYSEDWPDWYTYAARIRSCVIEEGVDSIGAYAFFDLGNLTGVEIPASVAVIGASAFGNCADLADVYYGGREGQWNQVDIGSNNDYLLNAAIHFSGTEAGDINGDGEVDNKDLTRLFRHLSGWEVSVEEDALDVNGDGDVNNKDLTRLFRYLSGWDVEIF